jgi:hypothetical protein
MEKAIALILLIIYLNLFHLIFSFNFKCIQKFIDKIYKI